MNQQKLQQILDKHKLWLDGKPGVVRANLSGANLSYADLSGANLYRADLFGASLFGANLSGANLSGANLSGANLYRVDLSRADLFGANLYRVDLSRADLFGANLSGANLSYADLFKANLSGANLSGADLFGANLRDAQIEGTKFSKFQIPQTKTLYVYKKLDNGKIAHLRIPRTAQRTATPLGNKCRAERAFVLKIVDRKGNEVSEGRSMHDPDFLYRVGEFVSVPNYNPDIRVECTSGIHFFMTEEEAQKY